jgi:hypothetical protein
MNSLEAMKREVLRLAKAGGNRACIRRHQLSAVFNLPEIRVRQELAGLAEQKLILLAGWDGHGLRDYATWANADEFIHSSLDGGNVHIQLPGPGADTAGISAFAAGAG